MAYMEQTRWGRGRWAPTLERLMREAREFGFPLKARILPNKNLSGDVRLCDSAQILETYLIGVLSVEPTTTVIYEK